MDERIFKRLEHVAMDERNYERLEHVASRLVALSNGERGAHDTNPACASIYSEFLKQVGKNDIESEDGPGIDNMLGEFKLNENKQEELAAEGCPDYVMPRHKFFYAMGSIAYKKDTTEYEDMRDELMVLISEMEFRAECLPIFYAWCLHVALKLLIDADPDSSTHGYIEDTEKLLNNVFFYLCERTEVTPHQMLMDMAMRLMRAASKAKSRPCKTCSPRYWPTYVRIFATRCLKDQELPFTVHEMCYKLTSQATSMLGRRFWRNDEMFFRNIAKLTADHWTLMLEGQAPREPMVHAYDLFLEIFLLCDDRSAVSDQSAITVAGNCREILEATAAYVRGEEENPDPLREGQEYIMASLLSKLVASGAFQMIHEDDEKTIVEWWLKHSHANSDVFRQLMICSTYITKLDTRVLYCLAAYYERAMAGDVPDEEQDRVVFHWVLTLIQDDRTDFYDRSSLSDCVPRLQKVRAPKKYVDALKKLKC